MTRLRDLTGKEYERLTVLARDGTRRSKGSGRARVYWLCLCKCGTEVEVVGDSLKAGNSRSCGCLMMENAKQMHRTHGMSKSGLHCIWSSMIQRCENRQCLAYADYGGRGITVCRRWRESFVAFMEDVGARPSPKHSLDRIDNDKGYEPGNIRWATAAEQRRNQRKYRPRSEWFPKRLLRKIARLSLSY